MSEAEKILAGLSRPHKVVLYVMGMLDKMKADGEVVGGKYDITELGDQVMAALMASGFKPTPEEINWAMEGIIADSQMGEKDLDSDTSNDVE